MLQRGIRKHCTWRKWLTYHSRGKFIMLLTFELSNFRENGFSFCCFFHTVATDTSRWMPKSVRRQNTENGHTHNPCRACVPRVITTVGVPVFNFNCLISWTDLRIVRVRSKSIKKCESLWDLSQTYFMTLCRCSYFGSLSAAFTYLFLTSLFLLLLPLFEYHFIVVWDHGIILIFNLHC